MTESHIADLSSSTAFPTPVRERGPLLRLWPRMGWLALCLAAVLVPQVPATGQGVGTAYCTCVAGGACALPDPTAGCVNSTGVGATLTGSGSADVVLDDLQLVVANMRPAQFGYLIIGTGQAQAPFGDGLLCVAVAGAARFPLRQADAAGVWVEGPGVVAHSQAAFPPPVQIVAGSTYYFQGLYRDAGGPCGTSFNLTNGLAVTFNAGNEITLPEPAGEPFLDNLNEDVAASGGDWGAGMLTWGLGGGSGRLGPLQVRAGTELLLDTDGQLFPLAGQVRSLLDNAQPGIDYNPLDQANWPTLTLTDGVFEFSSVTIEAGGRLVLVGSNPGRILVRGELLHEGVIDLSGETPAPHISNSGGMQMQNPLDGLSTRFGGAGGVGGPAAGVGGQGADRYDSAGSANPLPTVAGGIVFPNGEIAVNDGRVGAGVGGNTSTGGVGGLHYPPTFPRQWELGNPLFGDAEISILPLDTAPTPHSCGIAMVAGPGSGGAYALAGGAGLPASPFAVANPGLLPNAPSDTPGGDNGSLNLEPPGTEIGLELVRHLDSDCGHLRGGAGGGGGGTSLYGTKNNNNFSSNGCMTSNAHLFPFFDHSAAGGGGGGGALQLVAGRRISVSGSIDCSGGSGGSALEFNAPLDTNCTESGSSTTFPPDGDKMAAPGGGGSGGALRLQSRVVTLGGAVDLIDVRGGQGGLGAGGSIGGIGSPGLVRIEHSGFVDGATDAALFAPFVAPAFPNLPSFNTPYTSAAILSLGSWDRPNLRPETFSGSQSCWIRPVNNASDLLFSQDDLGQPDDPDLKGWNMDIRYRTANGIRSFPYRGLSSDPDFPNLGGLDFETFLGTTLNHDELNPNAGSLLVVRFQGARATGALVDLCDVDLQSTAEVEAGSLTPWVRSPQDLNQFSPRPNMLRFAVIFEPRLAAQGAIQANVKGVTNLRIKVQLQ